MRKFTVVIIQPPNYVQSLAFYDIGQLLVHTLETLGHEAELHFNNVVAGQFNIILGYHLLDVEYIEQLRSYEYAVFQLEQLSNSEGWAGERVLAVLKRAKRVWDYSEINLAFLENESIASGRLLPIGYHPALRQITLAPNPDIDILFYGLVNERRQAVLDDLRTDHIVETLFEIYGDERNRYIARSKIVLNVHFYEAKITEQVRLAHLLNNRCMVVSESSTDRPFGDALLDIEYDQLASTCRSLIADAAKRDEWAKKGHSFFKNRPMADYVQQVLAAEGL